MEAGDHPFSFFVAVGSVLSSCSMSPSFIPACWCLAFLAAGPLFVTHCFLAGHIALLFASSTTIDKTMQRFPILVVAPCISDAACANSSYPGRAETRAGTMPPLASLHCSRLGPTSAELPR